ncbi:MAG TPA: IS21 family transposase [Gaiellaceae bacterium]|nr:IS21 family transposase [Gaiellaceae bacterium]
MFREVSVVEAREVLRLWLRKYALREIARMLGMDRKTVHRYVDAAVDAGLLQSDDERQLGDELLGAVIEEVRTGRPSGHGESWQRLERERAFIAERIEKDLRLTKIHELLARRGVVVPYRTLHRFAVSELGFGQRQRATVLLADGEPGSEVQVDFGRMGLVPDPRGERHRVAHGLVFTPVVSRYRFCWLTLEQTTAAVIEGFEAAWSFYGGVFKVAIPDNLKPVVIKADPIAPRFNVAFLEYAQARGFVIDPGRVRRPTDKGRVENAVPYCREAGFAGEDFTSFEAARLHMITWSREGAGMKVHRTTQRRPREHFEEVERAHLLPAPTSPYDLPTYATPTVGRDRHIQVAKALYSVPGEHIGQEVDARADRELVRISLRGALLKVHPRQRPGGRSTDPADLPEGVRAYAMRDTASLRSAAAAHGAAVGTYAERLLEGPLPWTKMRQVYRLLGLARRYGAARVNAACERALVLDVVDVTKISRMLERALEGAADGEPAQRPHGRVVQLRFSRSVMEFSLAKDGVTAKEAAT